MTRILPLKREGVKGSAGNAWRVDSARPRTHYCYREKCIAFIDSHGNPSLLQHNCLFGILTPRSAFKIIHQLISEQQIERTGRRGLTLIGKRLPVRLDINGRNAADSL